MSMLGADGGFWGGGRSPGLQSAVDFNGTSGYVSFSSAGSFATSGAISIAAWVRADAFGTNSCIVGNNQLDFRVTAAGLLSCSIGGVDCSAGAISANTNYFIVLTYAGGTWSSGGGNVKAYIDAVDTALSGGGSTTPTWSATAYIGRDGSAAGGYFNGKIAQVSIWTSALTQNEVTALYNGGVPIDPQTNAGNYASSSTLVHHFPMNEGTGTTIYDYKQSTTNSITGGYTWAAAQFQSYWGG
jgi:hypothetical protein